MTAPNAPGLTELGIAGTDADLLEAARTDPVIAAEVAARQNARNLRRLRAGPLQGAERTKIVTETISQLRRDSTCF